jgi:signal transduction histidine kinase/HAMP domain-containing protein
MAVAQAHSSASGFSGAPGEMAMANFASSVRSRLILLILGVVLPSFVLILYSASKHHELSAKQIKLNALMAARAIASEQDRVLDNAHQFLITVSRVPQVRGDDKAACHKILSGLLEPRYADLIVADRNGRSVCTALKSESTLATASGMHHKTAVETFDFAVGNIRFHGGSKKLLLDVSYPIMEPAGVIRAVISAAVDLSWLSHITVDNHLYPGATFSLINQDGIVLQRYPEGLDWLGKSILGEGADGRTVAGNAAETAELTGADGVRRLFAFSPLKNAFARQPAYAVIDIPVETAFVKTREILVENLIALGIFSAIVLGLAWFGADLFVLRRIKDIIAATHKVASGDLKARTTLPYDKSELGQMAEAFDHLAQALETRKNQADESTRQIHKQRQQQETLYQLTHSITATLDVTSVLRTLLDHICALFPACAVSVSWANKDTRRLEPIACRGFKDDDQALAELAAATSLPGSVFTSQVPVAIADAGSDERNGDRDLFLRHQLRSYVGLPLIVRQDVLGVLSLYTSDSMECAPEEVSFLGVLVDEAAIAIHNSRLFERTLEQALELEKSNKIKDEFLGVMSHELRTPLNIIMNYAEALKMETFGEMTAGQIRAIDKIRTQARELLLLINGILEITKIESHTVAVQNEALHLMEFISEIRSDYDFPMEKNLALEWQYVDLPLIMSDGAKLRHILTNLINNAIKFTEKGTIAVSACATPDKSTLDLRVADTGPGIPEKELPFVFDKFRQVDSATTRNHCGVGLGLFIVKNFVELLGGSIEVTSTLGEGSVFIVRLPIRAVPDPKKALFEAAPALGPAA